MKQALDIRIQRHDNGALRALLERDGESLLVAALGPPLSTAPGAERLFSDMLKEAASAWLAAAGAKVAGFTTYSPAEDN